MLKKRYEILLPLKHNDGRPVGDLALNDTRSELLERFDGVSMAPQPMLGAWIHEGQRFEDLSVRVIIDVEDTAENRQFFVEYKRTLLVRFEQLEIYIVSYPVEIV